MRGLPEREDTVIRLAHIGTETGTAELSSLLTQLNAYSDSATRVRPPSPAEAMAIYSVAVRLVRLQMTMSDRTTPDSYDVAVTRDLLLGTRRMLRAALERLEPVGAPRLMVLDGGAARS